MNSMIGEVDEKTWTLIAEEQNDEPVTENLGRKTMTRYALFAFRVDALEWALAQYIEESFEPSMPSPLATLKYVGETDSPSSCWSVEVKKEL